MTPTHDNACLMCDHTSHNNSPVPCIEHWALILEPRPVETLTLKGDRL